MVIVKNLSVVFCLATVFAVAGVAFPQSSPNATGVGATGTNARYATDAYPGFDSEESILSPSRKEPRWFAFINGPAKETAAEQFAYACELMNADENKKARKEFDALVREWPTAPEAPKAQLILADLDLEKLFDYEEAFDDYRYLLDFYSLQCDYNRVADRLYQVAGMMRAEGKEVMFIRFANTVDVRRAYEACVLHAPGAKWVPEAMMVIAQLREDEGKPTEAVKVYENLRNLHPRSEMAPRALSREAEVRMQILREHAYNRARCQDTIDFLRMALGNCSADDTLRLRDLLNEAMGMVEDEAYRGAVFYDSKTRTARSAINAYERFLADYPEGKYADEVRARLEVLKGKDQ